MAAPSPMREAAREMRRQGLPLSQIAEACGVTKVCVSLWCRDLPEHRAAAASNTAASYRARRIYPAGTRAYVNKLIATGIPADERLRLAREFAAEQAATGDSR